MTAETKDINTTGAPSSVLSARVTRKTVEILDLALGAQCPFSSEHQLPPPLDEVTIYSSSETDCSSTCSSVSLEHLEAEEPEDSSSSSSVVSSSSSTPRSIFQRYWEKHHQGTEAAVTIVDRSPSPALSEGESSRCASTNTYERVLEANEARNRSRRRRIFSDCGCHPDRQAPPAFSEEVLSLVGALRIAREPPRKTRSSPTLPSSAKARASCLRSPSKQRKRSDSSVTFSQQVDVVYFERPKELWASDGWSKYFSS